MGRPPRERHGFDVTGADRSTLLWNEGDEFEEADEESGASVFGWHAGAAAGRSRLWMGIHVPPDDFGGRRVGARCGRAARELAVRHFEGAAA